MRYTCMVIDIGICKPFTLRRQDRKAIFDVDINHGETSRPPNVLTGASVWALDATLPSCHPLGRKFLCGPLLVNSNLYIQNHFSTNVITLLVTFPPASPRHQKLDPGYRPTSFAVADTGKPCKDSRIPRSEIINFRNTEYSQGSWKN